jgi:hypothetical protein
MRLVGQQAGESGCIISKAKLSAKKCNQSGRGRVILEWFHNSRAFSGILPGGIFLRKMPLEGSRFGVQRLWNHCIRRGTTSR